MESGGVDETYGSTRWNVFNVQCHLCDHLAAYHGLFGVPTAGDFFAPLKTISQHVTHRGDELIRLLPAQVVGDRGMAIEQEAHQRAPKSQPTPNRLVDGGAGFQLRWTHRMSLGRRWSIANEVRYSAWLDFEGAVRVVQRSSDTIERIVHGEILKIIIPFVQFVINSNGAHIREV